MPTLETLTEADLRGPLSPQSLRRAPRYTARVEHPVRTGRQLTAQVRGTRLYEVEIMVMPSGIVAFCTCPFDWAGYCKHIGAVLLKWIHSPISFSTRDPPVPATDAPSLEVTPVEAPRTHRPAELPYWLTTSVADRQRADEEQLGEWLAGIKVRDLRLLARDRGWPVKGARKAEIIRQILQHLTSSSQVLRSAADLDGEHQKVLRAMVLLGDYAHVQAEDLVRVAEVWGELKNRDQIESYTRHLCQVGLAVPGHLADTYRPQGDFIPFAIVRQLPPVLKGCMPDSIDLPDVALAGTRRDGLIAQEPGEPVVAQPTDGLRLGDPYALVRAASQIVLLLEQSTVPLRPPMPRPRQEKYHAGLEEWDYVPDELLRPQTNGNLRLYAELELTVPPPRYSLPDESIERLAPVAGGPRRLEFIYSVLVAAGILQPGSPVTAWQEVKERLLDRDELAQRAILSRAFIFMPNWSALRELLQGEGENTQTGKLTLKRVLSHRYFKPQNLRAELIGFRHIVLRVLASLPDGHWVATEDLCHLMRAIWPRFDGTTWQTYRLPNDTGTWFLTEVGDTRPLRPGNDRHWRLAQGDFIRTLISGPLHWLGLVDLSFQGGRMVAFRPHGLGDLFWDRVETPPAPRHVTTRAQAVSPKEAVETDRLTITVQPSNVTAQLHNLLDRIARLETTTAECFVYRVDARAAHEAFLDGVTLSEILDQWEHLVPIPLPEDIRTQLEQWWQAYGQVRIYEDLTIIEFGDDYTMAEMKAVTSLEEHLIAEVCPRLAIIRREAIEPLIRELESAGYTPKRSVGG